MSTLSMPDISAEKNQAEIEKQDQQLRRNIQWGIVRGLFLYTLLSMPLLFVAAIIYAGVTAR